MVARLREGDATVMELAEPFALKLPTVSKHLKVLRAAGLVSQSTRAQWRLCRLEPEPLRGLAEWVERYRELWEARHDRLAEYLQQLQEPQGGDR